MTVVEKILTVAIAVVATVLTRFLPYICFSKGKTTPPYILYLGKTLAPAVFSLLVVYCFKDVNIQSGTYGLSEFIAGIVVILTFLWKRDMLLSMAGGTILYMVMMNTGICDSFIGAIM